MYTRVHGVLLYIYEEERSFGYVEKAIWKNNYQYLIRWRFCECNVIVNNI